VELESHQLEALQLELKQLEPPEGVEKDTLKEKHQWENQNDFESETAMIALNGESG
jgi:hypothetical protein